MGWFSHNSKKVAMRFFNFRIDQWVDYEFIKSTTLYFLDQTKQLFTAHKLSSALPRQEEDFSTAQTRLNLDEAALQQQALQYKRLALFFLCLTLCLFLYLLFLIWARHNYMGACMTFALVLYGLSQAIRYHFWYFQIQQRKLGCTLQEWWSDLLTRGFKTR